MAPAHHPAHAASAPLSEVLTLVLSELHRQVDAFGHFSLVDAAHDTGLALFAIHAALRELQTDGRVVRDDFLGWLPTESN